MENRPARAGGAAGGGGSGSGGVAAPRYDDLDDDIPF